MTDPVPMNRMMGRAIALHDRAPNPAKIELMEMLGIIAVGCREILPDQEPVVLEDGFRMTGSTPPGLNRDSPPPMRDRSTVPAGLRDLPARMGRPPEEIVHGTVAGYRKHLRRKDPACEACLAAERERASERRPPPTPRPDPAHGTAAGYRRHRRDGEEVCADCQDGAREEWAARKRAKPKPARVEPPAPAVPAALPPTSPVDAAKEISRVLEAWIVRARSSRSPKVREAGLVAMAAVVRMRVAVEQLEAAQRRARPQAAPQKESA